MAELLTLIARLESTFTNSPGRQHPNREKYNPLKRLRREGGEGTSKYANFGVLRVFRDDSGRRI
jgi:hypothetical protein